MPGRQPALRRALRPGGGPAYGALVAFAFTPDLRHAVFTTPKATGKFSMLTRSGRVALLIDNRPDRVGEFMNTKAVTVTGRATHVEGGEEFHRWVELSSPVTPTCDPSSTPTHRPSSGWMRCVPARDAVPGGPPMGSRPPLLIPLDHTAALRRTRSPAARRRSWPGSPVRGSPCPPGSCLTASAYEAFLDQAKITTPSAWNWAASRWRRCAGRRSGTPRCASAPSFSPAPCPATCSRSSPTG